MMNLAAMLINANFLSEISCKITVLLYHVNVTAHCLVYNGIIIKENRKTSLFFLYYSLFVIFIICYCSLVSFIICYCSLVSFIICYCSLVSFIICYCSLVSFIICYCSL